MDYLQLGQPRLRGRPRVHADRRQGQTGRDHRRRRHRRRLPRHCPPPGGAPRSPSSRSSPCPGKSARPNNPWPTWPPDTAHVSSAHEEGGERLFARQHDRARRRRERARRSAFAPAGCRARRRRRPPGFVPRRRAWPRARGRARALAMGFQRSRASTVVGELGLELSRRGNVAVDANVRHERPGRLRLRGHGAGPEPHRLGDSRGPLGRRLPSTATCLGATGLPAAGRARPDGAFARNARP